MKITLVLVLIGVALCLNATPSSLLQGFGRHANLAQTLFKEGETSDVFALLMKMKIAFDEKDSHEGLPLQTPMTSNKTCNHLLTDFAHILNGKRWHKNITGLRIVMDEVASKCTSSDFETKKLKGFDDQCALCVVILRVIENYIAYHNRDVAEFINKQLCQFFQGVMHPTCQAFVHYAGPIIISSIVNQDPSDVICLKLHRCRNSTCRITSYPPFSFEEDAVSEAELGLNKIPSWDWLVKLFTDHFGDGHFPPFDMDNDTFSDISTFRGYNWKGQDCNEFDAKVYPGRKTGNKYFDHDCNGIFGVSNIDKKPYESLYCDGTTRLGVAVIGDSAGAHFSIPQKYFNVSMIAKGTYKDLLVNVADELDLPHQSAYTAHTNTSEVSHSIYKYLRGWNLCNNNDYQNLGVNGGDSGNTMGNIKALKRDPKNDHPMLIFMELIGNDVCSKTPSGMTTVEKFKTNVLNLLNWLDKTVPAGSHLWIFGLADGDILYENLHNLTHPLDVTYATVYDFLNCLQISPCAGWLSTNSTARNVTTERARELSKVYKQIQKQYTFKNFDIVYEDFPQWDIINRRIIEGGDPAEMIEPCDGFHPGGRFNSYLADWTWNKIQTDYPDWIGAKNPHNQQILDRFHLKTFNDTRVFMDEKETIEIEA